MKKVKGFSYDTEKDKQIIDHIEKQPNGSHYIWELVRKDMQGSSIEEIVRREIQKYAKDINFEKKIEIDTNEIMRIKNL